MKNIKWKLLSLGLACALTCGALGLAACSGNADDGAQAGDPASEEYPAIDMAAMDLEYTDRDKDASYDAASATKIILADNAARVEGAGAQANGATVTISSKGTYIVSGDLGNGQLVVDAPDTEKVQVVLENAQINNNEGPAINIKQADKCFITLAPASVNTLTDSTEYALASGEDEPNATLFSKADLTINGSGALNITGSYRHAVNSKDDLVITGGTFEIAATEDALRGKDCVKILDGAFNITAGEDAIKSNNDSAADKGYVCIDGGEFVINAGDDAVHAETVLMVNNGMVDIQSCEEGYEAEQLYITGADTQITSNDDALNASARGPSSGNTGGPGGGMGGNASDRCILNISGGTTVLNASGDGVDSNGSIEISGGVLLVSGPTSDGDGALDYESSATITGGTVLMVGSAGMAEAFSSAEQPFIFAQISGHGGDLITITDEAGKELISFTPAKDFQTVLASALGMANGSTYNIAVKGNVLQATATLEAQPGSGMGPGRGGGPNMGAGPGGDPGMDPGRGGDPSMNGQRGPGGPDRRQ